ncbi:MAG: DNA repair protein RecN [Rhodobacteraceae bacterium]|nr:DNA repair protein RecN [Paracoccaceae bacterium]
MLRGLSIRNMLLIDRLDLDVRPGLNVLTGETGAGKSILLDTLGFVLGWRGRADLVRKGAGQGEVSAEFHLAPAHPARAALADHGLSGEDGVLLLRRTTTPDGRKTAWVNDRRVSAELLRGLSDTLVELHGQNDDRGLLNTRGHRALLDDFAGTDVSATRRAWNALAAAREALETARTALAEAEKDADFLRLSLAEIRGIDPRPGEDEKLATARRRMQAAARIREDIAQAARALGPDAAEGLLHDATRWLEGVADRAETRLDAPLEALGRALAELGEAQSGVEGCLAALSFGPAQMEETEERLFAIRGLARKHGVAPDNLGALAEDMGVRLAAIDTGPDHIARLEAGLKAAEHAYTAAAAALSDRRRRAAARLDQAMGRELAPLRLDRAGFETRITPADPGPDGADAVVFTAAPAPGVPAGPLGRIASGGELSRFLLALRLCLARDGPGMTLIFDEIDRGVGGATADAVGRRLAGLAEGGQILVVTHSPQVAARGSHHWQVSKSVSGGATLSRVRELAPEARRTEIARMLSGDIVTPEAEAAAAALLKR